jgi:hypothetical protein
VKKYQEASFNVEPSTDSLWQLYWKLQPDCRQLLLSLCGFKGIMLFLFLRLVIPILFLPFKYFLSCCPMKHFSLIIFNASFTVVCCCLCEPYYYYCCCCWIFQFKNSIYTIQNLYIIQPIRSPVFFFIRDLMCWIIRTIKNSSLFYNFSYW